MSLDLTHELPLPVPPQGSYHDHLAALPHFLAGPESGRGARAADYLAKARAFVADLHAKGASGQTIVRLTTAAMDALVKGLFDALVADMAPQSPLTLVALGGYGRKELAPRSDLDLMLLRPAGRKSEAPAQRLAERLLYLLWDLKLEVGWSLRTPAECADAADDDHTARTALLDLRFLAGDTENHVRLEEAVLGDIARGKAERFIADKISEVRARRQKFGDSVYLLEPNLKQGEGGLRDLQAALWIALARFGTRGLTELQAKSVLPAREVTALRAARDWLWRVRNQLHLTTSRKEDRLTFDLQEAMAQALRYPAGQAGLPVEQFMRDYYLCARHVKLAADALIERCEDAFKPAKRARKPLDKEFAALGEKLAVQDESLFAREPLSMVRAFAVADAEGRALDPATRDRISAELSRLATPDVRREGTKLLATLMARPGTLGGFLSTMHELGVLGALVPEFGRVTALRQHDLYHVYTVDAHSLAAVRRLYALRAGELLESQPELTLSMQELERPLPLYLGMLFHDAGKGMGGNHSERGVELVHAVAERMGLLSEEREDAEFLVRYHLLMSHTSQRRDITDPSLVADFAKQVGTPRRLRLLYLLTYADICSVGPTTWTEWKGRLLRELNERAQAALTGAGPEETSLARYMELRDAAAARLMSAGAADAFDEVERFLRCMPYRYLAVATPPRVVRDLKLMRRTAKGPLGVLLLQRRDRSATTLSLTASDRAGLLADFAGVLAAHNLGILAADVFSSRSGPGAPPRALDVFEVRGPQGDALTRERFAEVKKDLLRVLTGAETVEQVLKRRHGTRLQPRKAPRVATRVAVDNQASRDFTVIDIVAEDRVGLLYAITSALAKAGLDVHAARVATEANRAIDAFYVRRAGKRVVDPAEVAAIEAQLRAAVEPTS
ncbi:MAG: [protein-PII] uridylyltransferase [Deltaproteobacteria bacterium]|nr:[protein-PII] uridylyltransferase [Deltaproteobacteria bacterium]